MRSLPCPLYERAATSPEAIALVTEEKEWSYQELDRAVSFLVQHLQKQGITPQTRVAFLAPIHFQTILLFWALFRLQAIAVPLSTRSPLPIRPSIDPLQLPLGAAPSSFPSIDPGLIATHLFTSGSTATPKIACHTFGNHYASALGSLSALSLDQTSAYLLSLPLYHVGGIALLFRTVLAGSTLLLTPKAPTHLSLVPTQLYRLLPSKPPPSLRVVLLGGAAASPSLLQQAQEQGWPLHTSYGMTEMSSLIALRTPLPLREVQIREGEIYVRGAPLFAGYFQDGKIVRPLTSEGWFATRDLGEFNGELKIVGRKDRQFISGGENIQPEEIERALASLPGIVSATVTPIDDPEWGQRPIARIVTTEIYSLESLSHALSSLLPRFKHPVQLSTHHPERLSDMRTIGHDILKS